MSTNVTQSLPMAAGGLESFDSFGSLAILISSLLWGSVELVISIGFISAYAHMLCYAVGLVLRDEQSLEHSNDPDLPKKEQTVALMLTGFLTGVHIMFIFFGLDLIGHGADSFLMKLLFSCAILAGITTGLIVGGTILYLIVPALISCGKSLTRRVKSSPKALDVEEAAAAEEADAKQPFLDEKEAT